MFAVGSAGASAATPTAATPTAATTAASSALAACTAPTVTQPFSSLSDANYYAPLPGESWDSFVATSWTLSGGAKLVSTKLADGATGTALDLPASAKAVSPSMCLTNDYPSARGEIRSVSGSAGVTVTVTLSRHQAAVRGLPVEHQQHVVLGHAGHPQPEQHDRLAARAVHIHRRQQGRVPALELLRRPEDAPLTGATRDPTTDKKVTQ